MSMIMPMFVVSVVVSQTGRVFTRLRRVRESECTKVGGRRSPGQQKLEMRGKWDRVGNGKAKAETPLS